MDMKDLSNEERLALFGLAKAIIQADEELSDGERSALKELGREMGRDAFLQTVKEATPLFTTQQAVRDYAETITRQEARDYIYERLMSLAEEDDFLEEERVILDWLKETWDISE